MPGGRQEKHEAKGKKKKEEFEKEVKEDEKGEGLEHCRLFYEYSGKESGAEIEFMVNFDELTSQIKWFKVEKWLGKERVQEIGKQLSESKR